MRAKRSSFFIVAGIAIAAGDIVLGEAAIETDTAEEQPNEQ